MQPLRLLARDAQDIQIISAVLQDAIAPVCDMVFREADHAFVMVVQRFCWGDGAASSAQEVEPASEDEPALVVYERVTCALDIEGVEKVQVQGLNPNNPSVMLDLLAVSLEGEALHLIFAGGGKIRLQLKNWCVRLHDFGESWPTTHCPRHVT